MDTSLNDQADISAFERELATTPIDQIDVARPRLFELDLARRYLDRMRNEAPVHFCADGMFGPYWSVTRWTDIEAVELDTETYSSEHANGGIMIASHPDDPQFFPSMIAMDPPRHGEQRKAIAPAFSSDRIEAMSTTLRMWAIEILEALPVGEAFDWVDRVSIEFTARTLAMLLGFPQEKARDLIRWSEATVPLVGTQNFPTFEDKLQVLRECFGTIDLIWAQRLHGERGDDLISMLAGAPGACEMPQEELYGNILLLIVGGNDTTRTAITSSVIAFDRHPEELQKLRAQPALIANLTPELLRWQTPVAHMRRTAMRDAKLGGKLISKGDKVVLWYLSANRDERVFERANDFVIDRPNSRRHLALGAGVHRCIGARLADLQVRILWEELLKRVRSIKILGSPRRTDSTFLNGFTELQVSIART